MKLRTVVVAALMLSMGLAACGGGGTPSSKSKAPSYGPISIWYSNNAQEITWGEQEVAAWNRLHPTQKVTGQQIPAAQSSEEVISAAITAGSEPCLIYNTAPAASAGLRAGGRSGAAQRLPRRCQLHPDAHRTHRQHVQVAGRHSTTRCRGSRTRS